MPTSEIDKLRILLAWERGQPQRDPVPFRVNPKHLKSMPMKPNHVDPGAIHQMDINNDGVITRQESAKYKQALEALRKVREQVDRRDEFSMSESQEIGWMLRSSKFSSKAGSGGIIWKPKNSSEISRYADHYQSMLTYSPYSRLAGERSAPLRKDS